MELNSWLRLLTSSWFKGKNAAARGTKKIDLMDANKVDDDKVEVWSNKARNRRLIYSVGSLKTA